MKTVIIVQARMTSTRLPGKVLKTIMGKPLLEYQIERLRRIRCVDEIVIATTNNGTEQPIVDLCNRLQVCYFRGSETDVLARYYAAAMQHQADIVVRVTSDCPVIDPQVCEEAIGYFIKNQHLYDYLRLEQYPRGLDTEVFSFRVLEEAFKETQDNYDREHVTPFFYRDSGRYRVKYMNCSEDYSHHRWTVDTEEDFQLVKEIIERIYPMNGKFSCKDILALMEMHPELCSINVNVKQK